MNTDLMEKFAQALSTNCSEFEINEEVCQRARQSRSKNTEVIPGCASAEDCRASVADASGLADGP